MTFMKRTAALAVSAAILSATPFVAQADPVEVGLLDCRVEGGAGFIFGSTKDVACEYKPIDGPAEIYTGTITKWGVDVGVTGETVMQWGVFAPSSTEAWEAGALAGSYVGAAADASFAAGGGAAVLVGGFDKSVNLQPVTVQAQEGVNIAVGVAELELELTAP